MTEEEPETPAKKIPRDTVILGDLRNAAEEELENRAKKIAHDIGDLTNDIGDILKGHEKGHGTLALIYHLDHILPDNDAFDDLRTELHDIARYLVQVYTDLDEEAT